MFRARAEGKNQDPMDQDAMEISRHLLPSGYVKIAIENDH